ncbi:Sugar kinase of the NBD/HSP70 family, may contain an N-terminal HTH domain [Georgenia satyanarayanai]|uniref:Sugar kinase of the NBD/HSP70 family, may contain an N-terminal HTH domain n=1 Tax=Georgenia satyanarayanai TaxID=860221 RepID=A0A2Y9C515_9MICO|nr:ROK family protein [Georgenia satyanarayanai]PYG00239.1 putative NBD/HSP70 family sugar kinase [Georgenia satyanarayanai]SSA40553.1 Sugar kinase of the NBD/HSP70 family, may contain an N-terminal HTH domain [Georgenia satyanarayanai]
MTVTDDAQSVTPGLLTPGVGQASLRDQNLSVVTMLAYAAPEPVSRAAIAAGSGLTRSTVSRLVDELLAGGLLEELPPQIAGRGRPATPLVPARGTIAGLGLEVSPSYLGARLVDLSGAVLAERVVPAHLEASDPDAVLGRLVHLARDILASSDGRWRVLAGARLAVPGLVDSEGRVLRTPNLGWPEVLPAERLRLPAVPGGTELAPVGVGNEADLAALAHALDAPGRPAGSGTFFYVSADIGVGGTSVVDGVPVRGRHGWAGEVGHTLVDPAGPPCTCGAVGCLEQYAGRDALLAGAGLGPDASAEELAAAAAEPGPARDAVDRAGRALGAALANVVNLLDVDDLVLGGQFIPLLPALRPALEDELGRRVLAAPWLDVTIRPGLSGEPALTGAALAVLGDVVAAPYDWLPGA